MIGAASIPVSTTIQHIRIADNNCGPTLGNTNGPDRSVWVQNTYTMNDVQIVGIQLHLQPMSA